MKKVGYVLFLLLLLGTCMVFSLGMLVAPPQEDIELNGNQRLATMPSLQNRDGSLNLDYLDGLVDYAGDNFFHRQDLISAWSYLNATYLHTSIAEDVVLGSNGWLYFGQTLPDYTRTNLLTDQEIQAAAQNLLLVQQYCQEQGAQFVFTIAPNKNSLYPENMPRLTSNHYRSNAENLEFSLASRGVQYVDLFETLSSYDDVLYFTQDSHWNGRGAAIGADAINKALGRSTTYGNGPFQPEEVHLSDLYGMLYPAGKDMETDLTYTRALTFTYDTPIRSADNNNIYTTHEGETGSLLLFRDSFGRNLYPYMADTFGKAYFSRATEWCLDQIEPRDVDSVVVELVERNIVYLITYVPTMPAPEAKLPTNTSTVVPEIVLQESASDLEQCVYLEGTLPETPDVGTSVYIEGNAVPYEAFQLTGNRFAMHMPAQSAAGTMNVIYTANGVQKSAPAHLDAKNQPAAQPTGQPSSAETTGPETSEAPESSPTPMVSQIESQHNAYLQTTTGFFAPMDPFTRGDAALLFAAHQANPVQTDAAWDDISADSPYHAGASQMKALGLIDPAEDGGFHPEASLTRAELVRILAAFWPVRDDGEAFVDVPSDHPAAEAIGSARAWGWVSGSNGNQFRPDDPITRCEAAVMSNHALGRVPDEQAIAEADLYFPDVPQTAWYYLDVMEASISHSFTASEDGAESQWGNVTAPDTGLPADFRTQGFHLLDGWSYYYSEVTGDVLRNTVLDGTWRFDAEGHQTTGDAEVDAGLREILLKIITPEMDAEKRLSSIFAYVRDGYNYGHADVADDENPFGEGFVLNAAKVMLTNGRGNCYNFASTFFYLARWLGLNPTIYSGTLLGDAHSWTEIPEAGGTTIFDPQMAWRWFHDKEREDYEWYFYRFVDSTNRWQYTRVDSYGAGDTDPGEDELVYTAEVAPVDLSALENVTETGFYLVGGYTYYYDAEKGAFLKDATLDDIWTFDADGHYTTGDEDLDTALRKIVLGQCSESNSRAANLRALFGYCRDTYSYRKRDVPTQEEFTLDFVMDAAKQMISTGKGNCYSFSAVFYHLARWMGYDPSLVAGFVLYPDDEHCWVVIPDNDQDYIYDTQLEWRYVHDWGYVGFTWVFYHLQDTQDNLHYIESHRLK